MHQNCIIGANRISASNLFASFVSCIPRKNTSIPLRFIILMYFIQTTWQFRWNEFCSTQSFANLHCLMGAFLFFCSVCKWIDNCGAVGDDDDDGTLSHYGRNSTSHFFSTVIPSFFSSVRSLKNHSKNGMFYFGFITVLSLYRSVGPFLLKYENGGWDSSDAVAHFWWRQRRWW